MDKSKKALPSSSKSRQWTNEELQRLLDAIKIFGHSDYSSLQKAVGTKATYQIKEYLGRLQKRKSLSAPSKPPAKAPIEAWVHTIEYLLDGGPDKSQILAKVMSVLEKLEVRETAKDDKLLPNYSNIYRYLETMLTGKPATMLNPLEAALILDLLQQLSDELKSLDTLKQRQMIMEKYIEVYSKISKQNMEEAATNQSSTKVEPVDSDKKPEQTRKRPDLFSINPFSIPVKYLKLEKR